MPILFMALTALLIFLVLGGMFFAAMEAEHRKREKAGEGEAKSSAQTASR